MMQSRGIRAAQFLAFSVLIVATIAIVGRNDFSIGVDAGIHHALAEQLLQHRQWPLPSSSFLREISYYPPAAHFLGALVGQLFQSPFSGMLIVTAIALIVTYVVLAELMRRTSAAETAGSMVVFDSTLWHSSGAGDCVRCAARARERRANTWRATPFR